MRFIAAGICYHNRISASFFSFFQIRYKCQTVISTGHGRRSCIDNLSRAFLFQLNGNCIAPVLRSRNSNLLSLLPLIRTCNGNRCNLRCLGIRNQRFHICFYITSYHDALCILHIYPIPCKGSIWCFPAVQKTKCFFHCHIRMCRIIIFNCFGHLILIHLFINVSYPI